MLLAIQCFYQACPQNLQSCHDFDPVSMRIKHRVYREGHVKLITLIKLKYELNNLLISQVYKSPSITTRNATTMTKQQLIESQIGIVLDIHRAESSQRVIVK